MKQTIENPKNGESIPNISQLRKLSKQQLFQGIKSFIENQSIVKLLACMKASYNVVFSVASL